MKENSFPLVFKVAMIKHGHTVYFYLTDHCIYNISKKHCKNKIKVIKVLLNFIHLNIS